MYLLVPIVWHMVGLHMRLTSMICVVSCTDLVTLIMFVTYQRQNGLLGLTTYR
jgi:hypothetical protein